MEAVDEDVVEQFKKYQKNGIGSESSWVGDRSAFLVLNPFSLSGGREETGRSIKETEKEKIVI